MLFSQAKTPKPINIPFNWAVDYADGKSLTEYDFKTHKQNDFYLIKQDLAIKFGLFGNNTKMYFNVADGHFYIQGRRLDIAYINKDGTSYNLTNNSYSKDFITYKQAYIDYNKNSTLQNTNIESINFGYKTIYKKNNVNLFFQPIVCLPFGSSAYVEVKLTSNKILDGQLVFYISGKERDRFNAPLKNNCSGQIRWTIK